MITVERSFSGLRSSEFVPNVIQDYINMGHKTAIADIRPIADIKPILDIADIKPILDFPDIKPILTLDHFLLPVG